MNDHSEEARGSVAKIKTLDYASPMKREVEPPILFGLRVFAIFGFILCLLHCALLALTTVLAWSTKDLSAYTLDISTSLDSISLMALDWQRAAHVRLTLWLGISLFGMILMFMCVKPSRRLHRMPVLVFAGSLGFMILIEVASLTLLSIQLPIIIHPRQASSWQIPNEYHPEWIPMIFMAGSGCLVFALILVRTWLLNRYRRTLSGPGEKVPA